MILRDRNNLNADFLINRSIVLKLVKSLCNKICCFLYSTCRYLSNSKLYSSNSGVLILLLFSLRSVFCYQVPYLVVSGMKMRKLIGFGTSVILCLSVGLEDETLNLVTIPSCECYIKRSFGTLQGPNHHGNDNLNSIYLRSV